MICGVLHMGHYRKLYEKIKANPKDVSFEEIDTLLTRVGGFIRRNAKGDHTIYSHPDLKDVNDYVNIPFKRPIKEVYIKKALEKFEMVRQDF